MANENLIHSFDGNVQSLTKKTFFTLLLGVLGAGIIVGYLLSMATGGTGGSTAKGTAKKVAGIEDKKTFKDKAEGTLREGGIDGEGNFHLERPGGESQNVYLTSTTVDLSPYIGKKVRVWGETFTGEKAGWLMDVGSVELL
jgi:hypothetical protein